MSDKHKNRHTEAWIRGPSQSSTRSHEIHSNITTRPFSECQNKCACWTLHSDGLTKTILGENLNKLESRTWHAPANPNKHMKTKLAEFRCYIITKTSYWEMILMTENVKISNHDILCKFPYKACRFLKRAKLDCCSIGKISSSILKDYCQAKLLPYPKWGGKSQVSLCLVTWNAFVLRYSKNN